MKKFKYRVIYEDSNKIIRSLVGKLLDIGYTNSGGIMDHHSCIVTHWSDNLNAFATVSDRYGFVTASSILVEDKDTFLALAAMVDDDKFYKGEWVVANQDAVALSNHKSSYIKGHLYQLREDQRTGVSNDILTVRDDNGCTYNAWQSYCFRKATKEEIIDHFKGGKVVKHPTTVAIDTETGKLRSVGQILSGKSWYEAAQSKFYDDWLGQITYLAGIHPYNLAPKSDITFITKPKIKKHKLLTF